MAKEKTFEDLFTDLIQDLYFAEGKLHKALGKMAKKCPNPKLASAYSKHQEETSDQIKKLEQVMKSLDIKVKGKKCPAILGILEEAEELMSEFNGEDKVLCSAMIAASQKAEHYEIASYGTLCQWAMDLGYKSEAKILHSILEQEKKTDETLTQMANGGINEAAEKKPMKKAA